MWTSPLYRKLVWQTHLKEKDNMFFWQGKSSDELRQHRVGFAVRNSLLNMVERGSNGFKRLFTLRLNNMAGPLTLVSVYAPTLSGRQGRKLAATISSIPSKEELVLLGDFNARVGADYDSWPSCLGQFAVGKMNDNGQRLLELCIYHNLLPTPSSRPRPNTRSLETLALKALAPAGSHPSQMNHN